MVLWPEKDGELTAFLRWLTHTHSMRWHAHYHTGGTGHIYQGRFKSFPVETDDHFYTVVRYVERNAQRANLVSRAESWRWGSLWRRQPRDNAQPLDLFGEAPRQVILHDWPVAYPPTWQEFVNEAQTEAELEAVRRAVTRNCPFGSEDWTKAVARRLGLDAALNPLGRPKKREASEVEPLF